MWSAPPLSAVEIERLQALRAEHDLTPLAIHGSYLLNLASEDAANRRKAVRGFRDEVERGLAIGADYLVIHPGNSKGQETERAIETLADSFAEAAEGVEWGGFQVLLENTAGGGASLGRDFNELARIGEAIVSRTPAAVEFCIDTAHLFAMGWDVSTAKGLRKTLKQIDGAIGLQRVKVVHTNDSKTGLGSRVDRHEQIGKGEIGLEAFRRIVNHPKLRRKAFILETPHGADGTHRANVELLKKLAGGSRTRRASR